MYCRICIKLSKKYHGPFCITKKNCSVAYQLQPPLESSIFPVFHIGHLKPSQGDQLETAGVTLPLLALDVYLIVFPTRIVAYRRVKQRGAERHQVLVEWAGLSEED